MCDVSVLPLYNVFAVLPVVFFPFFFFIPFDYDYFSSIIRYFVLCFKTEPDLGRIAVVTYHSTNKYTHYYTSLFLRLPPS